jgi:hypothetical protein
MARLVSADTDHISITPPTNSAPGSAGTISIWLKPTWNSGDSVAHYLFSFLGNTGGSANIRFHFDKEGDNNIYCGWLRITPLDNTRLVVADTGLFASGTWAHWAYRWSDSANTQALFFNGTSIASSGAALTAYSLNERATLGNFQSAINDAEIDGSLAEYGLYDTSLSNDEITALAKGFSPALVAPASLQAYLPLIGNASPETNLLGEAYTVGGATKSDHPRIYYPTAPYYPSITAAAPPAPVAATMAPVWFH